MNNVFIYKNQIFNLRYDEFKEEEMSRDNSVTDLCYCYFYNFMRVIHFIINYIYEGRLMSEVNEKMDSFMTHDAYS